jgi:MFS family permease
MAGGHESRNFSYIPIFILEMLRVFGVGMMTTASTNHLLLELSISPGISSFITGLYSAGFMLCALVFGSLSDRWGQARVIKIVAFCSFIFGLLCLIPITNTTRLILFAIWRFGDGGCNGIFWPTVQNYGVVASHESLAKKQWFLARYNFSWNFGVLLSMILGAFLVYFTRSNYSVFYINLLMAGTGLVVALVFLQVTPKNQKISPLSFDTSQSSQAGMCSIPGMFLSIPTLLSILLTHSLTDGIISIMLPLKISAIGWASYWVFLVSLCKSLMQTVASTWISQIPESRIPKALNLMIFILPVIWLLFIITSTFGIILSVLVISGIVQGGIYAIGCILMTHIAELHASSKPYTYFQAAMSGGRMSGPWIAGIGFNFTFYFGIWALISYQLCIGCRISIRMGKKR